MDSNQEPSNQQLTLEKKKLANFHLSILLGNMLSQSGQFSLVIYSSLFMSQLILSEK